MRKLAFCICENKDADQLRGNREADQRLCFRYIDSTIPLLPKSHYRFEIRRNSVKSTVRSEIDHFRCKMGVGGKLFSSFSYNQNCSEVSFHVILL